MNTLDKVNTECQRMNQIFDIILQNKLMIDANPGLKQSVELQLLSYINTGFKKHCCYYLTHICDIKTFIEFDHVTDEFVEYFYDSIYGRKHIISYH